MLYDKFNLRKEDYGQDFFIAKAAAKNEILKNLNPAFSVREYQKEAL